LLAGTFYTEYASVTGAPVLLSIGLEDYASFRGCRCAIGNGHAVGVLVNLDAGGTLSVFAVPEADVLAGRSHRSIRLHSNMVELALPTSRPCFPVVSVLTHGVAVKVVFVADPKAQVRVLNASATPAEDQAEEEEEEEATTAAVHVQAGPLGALFSQRTALVVCGQNAFWVRVCLFPLSIPNSPT
jgi:hypothetical protein